MSSNIGYYNCPRPEYPGSSTAIEGHEYGVDIVCPLEGGVVAALARRKLAMRGETSVCQTIDPAEFFDLAGTLVAALGP